MREPIVYSLYSGDSGVNGLYKECVFDIEATVHYHIDTRYGEDIDGNRGVPMKMFDDVILNRVTIKYEEPFHNISKVEEVDINELEKEVKNWLIENAPLG